MKIIFNISNYSNYLDLNDKIVSGTFFNPPAWELLPPLPSVCGPSSGEVLVPGYCTPYYHSVCRYTIASRDIQPGQLVLAEQPAVSGPYTSSLPLCLQCYQKVDYIVIVQVLVQINAFVNVSKLLLSIVL